MPIGVLTNDITSTVLKDFENTMHYNYEWKKMVHVLLKNPT